MDALDGPLAFDPGRLQEGGDVAQAVAGEDPRPDFGHGGGVLRVAHQ
jgi:hypothetical protein